MPELPYPTIRLRAGYDVDEVEELLALIKHATDTKDGALLRALPDKIRKPNFTVTRWREGYLKEAIDALLEEHLAEVQRLPPRRWEANGVNN